MDGSWGHRRSEVARKLERVRQSRATLGEGRWGNRKKQSIFYHPSCIELGLIESSIPFPHSVPLILFLAQSSTFVVSIRSITKHEVLFLFTPRAGRSSPGVGQRPVVWQGRTVHHCRHQGRQEDMQDHGLRCQDRCHRRHWCGAQVRLECL